MDVVRFGIVGLGSMGARHARYFGDLDGAVLSAVCDHDAGRAESLGRELSVPSFTRCEQMFDAGIDAVLVATPHYHHPQIAIDALGRGLHVLCEKPLAVAVGEGRRMVEAAQRRPELKFGVMFQYRTGPLYRKMHDVVRSGELGEVTRVTVLATHWFRSWAYYQQESWRATWAGEGGGILLNQSSHTLDLLCWIVGACPRRVTAVAHLGKCHPIEVEDEVSAILEYDGGATGQFVASSSEAPGVERIEIACTRGRLVAEDGRLLLQRPAADVRELLKSAPANARQPQCDLVEIPVEDGEESRQAVTQNFVDAIRKNTPLVATGADSLQSLELGNAILLSGLQRKPVELPLDGGEYQAFLDGLAHRAGTAMTGPAPNQ